jgi:hypothetical protein
MAKAISMTISVPGAELWINYLEGNKRITSVEWTLPAGVVARCRIWDVNIDPVNPIYDQTHGGPETGSQNVPGNYRVVEDPEAPGFYNLPSNLLYTINMETIG